MSSADATASLPLLYGSETVDYESVGSAFVWSHMRRFEVMPNPLIPSQPPCWLQQPLLTVYEAGPGLTGPLKDAPHQCPTSRPCLQTTVEWGRIEYQPKTKI